MRQHWPRFLALASIIFVYLFVLNARPDFTRFNADDSESYMALADSLYRGRGYTRSVTPGDYIPHKTWPPGLPVLLIPAMAFGDDAGRVNLVAVKVTMVIIGLVGIVVTWFIVRRMTGSLNWADLGAIALATNGTYWDFSHQAMCEVPLIVHMLAAVLFVDCVWAGKRVSVVPAFGSGLFAGLGMLIKGHALGLGLLPLAYLIGTRRSEQPFARHFFLWLVYGVGMTLPFIGWTARNSQIQATGFDGINQVEILRWRDPNDGSKGVLTPAESLEAMKRNVVERVIYHVPSFTIPGLWHEETFRFPASGYVALPLTLILAGMGLWGWRTSLPLMLAIGPMALLNIIIPFGGAFRYWTTFGWLFTVILIVNIATCRQWGDITVTKWFRLLTIVCWGNLVVYVLWHERHPYSPNGPYEQLATLFDEIKQSPFQTSGVKTQNPHAFQLITGLPATGNHLKPDHAIIRLDQTTNPPEVIRSVYPWGLIKITGE